MDAGSAEIVSALSAFLAVHFCTDASKEAAFCGPSYSCSHYYSQVLILLFDFSSL